MGILALVVVAGFAVAAWGVLTQAPWWPAALLAAYVDDEKIVQIKGNPDSPTLPAALPKGPATKQLPMLLLFLAFEMDKMLMYPWASRPSSG